MTVDSGIFNAKVARVRARIGGANKDSAREFAEKSLRHAQNEAPFRSGDLRDTTRIVDTADGAGIAAGNRSVPYAGPIHWGWPKRNIRKNPFIPRGIRKAQGNLSYFVDRVARLWSRDT
jgi:hypothetical protein